MSAIAIHLEHVLISVHDVEASLAFYRRIFPEWVVRWEGPTSDGGRWIHFGPKGTGQPGYLSIHESHGAGPAAAPYASLGIQHVGFAHPDVDALAGVLAKAGIHPDDRADDGKYRRYYFLDPDGVELEFVQEL
jgi:catechol 2,3-dioxygenase-like lactoylglutathione lyase family enzyme